MVVDYPNSNKARKVYLCLFVGGGGSAQQVPKGLEAQGEDGEARVRFEASRQRQRKREKNDKRKSIKGKDWILRKKEVSPFSGHRIVTTTQVIITAIPTAGKRGCSSGLQIHRSQAESCILTIWCRVMYVVCYLT